MSTTQIDLLKQYGLIVGKKSGIIALSWIAIYFISQPFRREGDLNVLMLFAPMIGAIAGFVAGWYVATDAAEDSSLTGIVLWIILALASILPMWIMEWILGLVFRRSMHFGGFMLLTASTLMAMATAVWHSATQE